VILSGLVFLWIQSANSLAGQFNKAMEVDDSADEIVEGKVEERSLEGGTA
jgi:hypothetical protein